MCSQRERNAHTLRDTDSHSALFTRSFVSGERWPWPALAPRRTLFFPSHGARARRCAHDRGSDRRHERPASQAGCCSSEASPFGAPTRCSSWRRPSSATDSTGSRTARPAPGPTGSCGSTRCSAPGPSSRCAHPAPTRTVPCRGCASATTSRSTPCASSSSATRRRPLSSYRIFARRKRDGLIPSQCRFQVSLPTPLAPIAAFVAPEDQARIEPLYEAAMLTELATIFDSIPHDQLAVQWDTNFEFAMLDGVMPTWFTDPRSSIVERLVRLGRSVPGDVQLGYHFCHGHERHHTERPLQRAAARRHRERADAEPRSLARLDPPSRAGRPRRRALLRDARAAAAASRDAALPRRAAPRGRRRRREGAHRRRAAVRARLRRRDRLRVGPPSLPGRRGVGRAAPRGRARRWTAATRPASFAWPPGWDRVPDETWTQEPVDDFGTAYDNVDRHGWYRNLDPTVEELAHLLGRRRHHDRLLGRHRHPARPAEAADVRHPGRRDHRRQLAQVPPRRASRSSATTRRSGSGCCAS